jgi:anti-anti-sigma regulatory factor
VKIFGRFTKTAAQESSQRKNTPSTEARETSQKIDSIESEIIAEFGHPTLLQSGDTHQAPYELSLTQAMDEAAVVFANGQPEDAKALLLQTIHGKNYSHDYQHAWWMLFDLALAENQAEFFDHLALTYAKHFETSPPQWQSLLQGCESTAIQAELPVINFRGKLTETSQPALQQVEQLGLRHHHFRLEFAAITDIDISGCSIFLNVLNHWHTAGCGISIRNGEIVIGRIRQYIQTGRQDRDDSAWRLMIELLRLMNADQAYEAACVDYCLTYEVSPPASPLAPIKTAQPALVLSMPGVISLPIDKLLLQLSEYAQQASTLVLDCSHLRRIDFSAVTPWLTALHQLSKGKVVECRHTSFLVGRLLHLIGDTSRLHIIYRKP